MNYVIIFIYKFTKKKKILYKYYIYIFFLHSTKKLQKIEGLKKIELLIKK
jgi:hypothetical protein